MPIDTSITGIPRFLTEWSYRGRLVNRLLSFTLIFNGRVISNIVERFSLV
jgi:hypothetical protein